MRNLRNALKLRLQRVIKVGRLIVTDSKGAVLADVALIADGNAEKAVFADYLKLISTEWIKKV